jgi:hypothetical protein
MEPLDPPISETDHVLRLVHQNQYTTKAKSDRGAPHFKVDAFTLRPADTDGLSVYLERDGLASSEKLLATKDRPGEFFVVRIPVRDLQALGLSLDYTPHLDTAVPGHCSIPQAKYVPSTDPTEVDRVREVQDRLARLITRNRSAYVVTRPTDPRCHEAATPPTETNSGGGVAE